MALVGAPMLIGAKPKLAGGTAQARLLFAARRKSFRLIEWRLLRHAAIIDLGGHTMPSKLGGLIIAAALGLWPPLAHAQQTRTVEIKHLTVISSKPFDAVVAAFESQVGHPNMAEFSKAAESAKAYAELESVVNRAVGPTELMVFLKLDIGGVIRTESRADTPKALRYLVGNPLIMKEMAKHVIEAGAYAPVTILIDQRADGVHLTYDTMVSFLTPYGNAQALAVAHDLDAKVEKLLRQAADG
jgi:hypothetical protein